MSKFYHPSLLSHFLFRSPKEVQKRTARLLPYTKVNHQKPIPNSVYTETFLFMINCEYLYSPEFFQTRAPSGTLFNDLYQFEFQKGRRIDELQKQKLQNNLIGSIKKLNRNKETPTAYTQAEEYISMMTPKEARHYKKYLVYLYKWAMNQQNKLPAETNSLNEALKELIISKIYEGHSQGEELKSVEHELKRIQTLAKAREGQAKGDINLATKNYEAIFSDNKNDANTRMQALKFLCKQSIANEDEGYLLTIMEQIEELEGEEHHKKYIKKTLKKINQNLHSQNPDS